MSTNLALALDTVPTASPQRTPSERQLGATPAPAAFVQGGPRVLLRLEGAAFLLTALAAYHQLGGGWGMFALLFLVPDLSMLGYLVGPRVGAALYNAGHSMLSPVALGVVGAVAAAPLLLLLAVIWVGHIGFDRMLGYGLKYESGFFDTHLGRVGKTSR